jgi:hypothetical protein
MLTFRPDRHARSGSVSRQSATSSGVPTAHHDPEDDLMQHRFLAAHSVSAVVPAALLAGALAAGQVMAATEWNVSLWGKRRAFTENVEKLAELVEAKTHGDFRLNISYGGLSKARENLDGIAIGAFEMAQFCSFYHRDKNPTITVTELPFARDVSLARTAEIQQAVHEHPIVVADLARWNATLLMPTPLPQYNLVGKGEPPADLEDFSGLRVRGPGGVIGVLGKLGAVGTSVPIGLNCFVVAGVRPECSVQDVFRGVTPFFVADVLTIAVLIAFPGIVLWLPGQMGYG